MSETPDEAAYRLHLLQRVYEFRTRFGWRVNTIYHRLSGRLGFRITQRTSRLSVEDSERAIRMLEQLADETRKIESDSLIHPRASGAGNRTGGIEP